MGLEALSTSPKASDPVSLPAATELQWGRHAQLQGLSLRAHQPVVVFRSHVQGVQDTAAQRLPLGKAHSHTQTQGEQKHTGAQRLYPSD